MVCLRRNISARRRFRVVRLADATAILETGDDRSLVPVPATAVRLDGLGSRCNAMASGLQEPTIEMTLRIDDTRKVLVERRATLFRTVARVEDDLRWLDTNVEIEVEEEGQEENIARLLARLDDRGKAEIEAIDAALARIATGDYGRCVVCGNLIPASRLEAMPEAATCVGCAAKREHGVS
jgi:DnaK suppressor protein